MGAARFQDWPARLGAFLASGRTREFAWGQWDCCMAAFAGVEAQTGVDPAAAWRGTYSTEAGAEAVIAELGDGSLPVAVAEVCRRAGIEEIGPLFAQRGDLVLLAGPGLEPILGVVGLDSRVAAPARPSGWRTAGLRVGIRAWRV